MAPERLEFNHAMIYARDMGRSLDFYAGVLGFELLEVQPPFYARLKSPRGNQTIALHAARPEQRLDPAAEGVRLYFETSDLDALCDALVARGVRFEQMPRDMEWGWRHAYLADPDGHELSLYSAGERRLRKSP
jgi:hydroxymethylpyrimidine/phosphomethylpyrimidine kinase